MNAFEARNTPEGLFKRYAVGRIRHLVRRQTVTVAGALALGFLISPTYALIATILVLLGEAFDGAVLAWCLSRLRRGGALKPLLRLSAVSGMIQAATISVSVALAWVGAGAGSGAPFFAMIFLAGATLNAGAVLNFNYPASLARILVYIAALLALVGWELVNNRADHVKFEMIGAVMLAYITLLIIQHINKGQHMQIEQQRKLLRGQHVLARVNAHLVEQQEEMRKLAFVARHANDSIIISDASRRITWVNEAFTRITGYTFAEAVGKTPGELLNGPRTDPDTVNRVIEAVAKGKPLRTEILNYTRDRKQIWQETNIVPIVDAAGDVSSVIAIERDITAAKKIASDLAASRREAVRNAKAKADFLATMSHEIRTPMNGVIGMADLLCERLPPGDDRANAETIRDSAEALLRIINDILDISRLDADKVPMSDGDFSLDACVSSAVRLLATQAKAKKLYLDVQFADTPPPLIRADEGRLRQVLINLIGNAIKFTETGGVSVKVRITEAPTGGHKIAIDVRDTGIGINKEAIGRIFEQFSQADGSISRSHGGTGLGLAISRLIARKMGGDITVESTPGKGSCFTVTIHADPPASEEVKAPKPDLELEEIRTRLRGARILLAEDNKTNQLLIRKYLSGFDVDLSVASDGLAAIRMAGETHPDLILMDIQMPGADGLEASRRIRERDDDAPQPIIVALTANAMTEDRLRCLDAGMDDFLAKPIRKADLLQCLGSHLQRPPPAIIGPPPDPRPHPTV